MRGRPCFLILSLIGGFIAGLACTTSVHGQTVTVDSLDAQFFLRKEYALKIIAHTAGFGLGFTKTYSPSVFKKRIYEAELLNMKDPKEVKTAYPYADRSKSYVYGKQNYLLIARAGLGYQHLLNRKPRWGGVEVRYLYHAGISLGFAKPIYLYIINYSPSFENYTLTTEKYDPDRHFYDNIYGRAPFSKGFNQLSIHPGLYGKFGFQFDFGVDNDRVKALETGFVIDAYPRAVNIMAFNDARHLFMNFYLSLNFGKRYNRNPGIPGISKE